MPVMILTSNEQFLLNVVGNVASAFAIGQLLIGVFICRKIIRTGQAADVQLWPMIAMLCSAAVWLKYGLLKKDRALMVVNSIAVVLQTCYITIYYRYSNTKGFIHKQMTLGALLIFPVLIYIRLYIVAKTEAERFLGFYCSTMSVVSYGSPLSSLAHVVRTKNSDVMYLPLVLLNVILGMEWTWYGYLRHDPFIQVPNFVGLCLSIIQLIMKCVYPARVSRTILKSAVMSSADDNII